jgi:K+/H+ antiporter YhaU regulatory subunit KhtT
MLGIIGIFAFIIVLSLSLIITRIATIALTLTGLSTQASRFQARSAFTGTGFTTDESREVVEHPVRRKIIMWLMVARSAGFLTIILTLILSFATSGTAQDNLIKLFALLGGVVILWVLSVNDLVEKALNRWIARALKKYTDLDTRDYEGLLKLHGDYSVQEINLKQGDWLVGKKLSESKLTAEGISVLGIYREDGSYVGAPSGPTDLLKGDKLILYGRDQSLKNLDQRRADYRGDLEHRKAVQEQKRVKAEQEAQERQRKEEEKKQAKPKSDGGQ